MKSFVGIVLFLVACLTIIGCEIENPNQGNVKSVKPVLHGMKCTEVDFDGHGIERCESDDTICHIYPGYNLSCYRK